MSKSSFEEEIEKNGSLCYTIVGVSMLPLLRQRRDLVVVVKPTGRLKKYDVALYKMPDGRYILHRILKVRQKDYVICGDHCIRREFGITDEQILGVMESYVRNGKTGSVHTFGYRLYAHLVVDLYYPKAAALWSIWTLKRLLRKIVRTK